MPGRERDGSGATGADAALKANDAGRLPAIEIAPTPRLSATALQTVCGKGYDGFAIALVN